MNVFNTVGTATALRGTNHDGARRGLQWVTTLSIRELTNARHMQFNEPYPDGQSFVTNGKVIYVHEEIGMGVLFVDSAEEQLEILDSWLAGAARALAP